LPWPGLTRKRISRQGALPTWVNGWGAWYNTLGPLSGGAVAATAGIAWVFAMTAVLLTLNFVWVWMRVPEVNDDTPPSA